MTHKYEDAGYKCLHAIALNNQIPAQGYQKKRNGVYEIC